MSEAMPVNQQCELAGVTRSVIYAEARGSTVDALDLELLALIDKEYTRHPFYGSRRMAHYLRTMHHIVNCKRVQRLMRTLGLAGIRPGSHTSQT
jgi:putative transposase